MIDRESLELIDSFSFGESSRHRRLTDLVGFMPLQDVDQRWQAGKLLAGLLVLSVSLPLTDARAFDETPGANNPGQGAGATNGQANPATDPPPDATKPVAVAPQKPPGIAPEVPPKNKKEYQLDQRRRVQELRRMNMVMAPQIITNFQKNSREYRRLISQGVNPRKPQEMEILKSGLQFRILSMSDQTIQSDPLDFENALKSFRGDLGRAGSLINNNQTKSQFRELVCREAFPLLQGLLKHNLKARSAAIEVMQDLEVVPRNAQARLSVYELVDDELVKVLMDNDQPDAVKVRAANTITNYLQKVDTIPQIQMAFAEAVAKELEKPFLDDAYQWALLGVLEEVNVPRQVVAPKAAIVMCAAATFMQNKSFAIMPRCRAARVLGRAGYDQSMNLDVLAWAVAELTAETADMFSRAKDKGDEKWVHSAYYLYTAFHHWDRDEAGGRAPALPKGFLNRAAKSEVVRGAYTNSIPLIEHMLFQKTAAPIKALGDLLKWSAANKPQNLKYDQSCPPLAVPAANAGNNPPPGG